MEGRLLPPQLSLAPSEASPHSDQLGLAPSALPLENGGIKLLGHLLSAVLLRQTKRGLLSLGGDEQKERERVFQLRQMCRRGERKRRERFGCEEEGRRQVGRRAGGRGCEEFVQVEEMEVEDEGRVKVEDLIGFRRDKKRRKSVNCEEERKEDDVCREKGKGEGVGDHR